MKEFTLKHWQAALSKVYAKAAIDPIYRELCLTHPRQAVRKVSDIQLPRSFRFEFVDEPKEVFVSLLLPPLLGPIPPDRLRETKKEIRELTDWYVEGRGCEGIINMHTIGGGGTHGGSGIGPGSGSGSGEGSGRGEGGGSGEGGDS